MIDRPPQKQARGPLAATSLALLLTALPALADGISRDQHGGRGTAQVGALTGRGDAPSALTYNPAAITRLLGLQIEGGLDFANGTDNFDSTGGRQRANHSIQFPPLVYLSWRPENATRFTFGLGLDAPAWYRVDWNTAHFPGRFETRVAEVRLFELHPVVAYELDDHWSVGGGLRYVTGSLEYGFNTAGTLTNSAGQTSFELRNTAEATADALSFDLGVHYQTEVWGFGATYRGEAKLEKTDNFAVDVISISNPSQESAVLARFPFDRAEQGFSLPAELRFGVWIAPYPELKIELDAAFKNWAGLEDRQVRISSPSLPATVIHQPRDWKNTLSLRLAAEGELTDQWSIGGGIAFEPSPVPEKTLEPGFPRGDAWVVGLGGSYNLDWISFDVGYSLHDFKSRTLTGQDPANPTRSATYGGNDQVWSASARWRF